MSQNNFYSRKARKARKARQRNFYRKVRKAELTTMYPEEFYKTFNAGRNLKQAQKDFRNGILAVILVVIFTIIILVSFPGP